jgi:HD-like signal output (HDOD) protein
MWGWLQKRLRAKTQVPVAVLKPQQEQEVTPAVQVRPPQVPGSPFDHLLELQGRAYPTGLPLTDEQQRGDDEMVARVLVHFRQNKPAPSSLPAVSLQILNAVADVDHSLADLSRLIAQDAAISAGVLKVANSPTYRGSQEVETLRDAVTRLGLAEVGRVAGMVAARSLFQSQVRSEFAEFGSKWSEIFADSLVAARVAVSLAMRLKGARPDQVFLATLLHDLGRSVALRSIAALKQSGLELDLGQQRLDRVLERTHVEIGAEVHELWSLPRFSALVTVLHHSLGLTGDGEHREVHIVRLCSAMMQNGRQSWRIDQARAEIDESCQVLGLDGYELRSLDTELRAQLKNVAQLLTEKPLTRVPRS